jgi:hypothetical protein
MGLVDRERELVRELGGTMLNGRMVVVALEEDEMVV